MGLNAFLLYCLVERSRKGRRKAFFSKAIGKATLQRSLQYKVKEFEAKLVQEAVKFLNNQVAMRIGRKAGTIPKPNFTWIKILDKADIRGITTLQEVTATNTYIRRNERYHHAKSDLVASSFNQLEFFFDIIRRVLCLF